MISKRETDLIGTLLNLNISNTCELILFLVSSGMTTGIGHIRRSAQLATELKNRKHEVLFCIKHQFGSIEAFKKYKLKSFIFSRYEQLPELLSLYPQTKLIVSDLEDITSEYTKKITEFYPVTKLLALDYFDMEDEHVHAIINLCNHNILFARPVSEKVIYLEGPLFGILRPEFKTFLRKRKKKTKRSLKNLLVSFGGSDPRRHTLSVIPVLDDLLSDHKCSVTIVIGPNFIHKTLVLEAVKKSKFNIFTVEDPANIAKLMNKADLCICGSGSTILELAALGTPAMIVPQSPAENNFSKVFEGAGFARIVGSPDGINIDKLREAFIHFKNPKTLEQASWIGPQLCDGEGDERIINEINLLLNN